MRRTTIAAGLAATLVSGAAVAVPALAASGAPGTTTTAASTATSGLTATQEQALDQFLAAHPKVATALGERLDDWKAFADANPAVVAELKKVAALPQDQRRAELAAWAKAQPAQAKALREFRQHVRAERKQRREARQDRRAERKGTATPAPSATS